MPCPTFLIKLSSAKNYEVIFLHLKSFPNPPSKSSKFDPLGLSLRAT